MNSPHLPEFESDDELTRWVESVLADYRDESASREDLERLQLLLIDNPLARKVYRETNELSFLLETVSEKESLEGQRPVDRRTKAFRFPIWWATAAILALAAIVWRIDLTNSEPLASLSASHQAELGGSATRKNGTEFHRGILSLSSGIAHIEMQNGVEIILEDDCQLEFIDKKTVQIHNGKMRVHCPMEARGFEVIAPDDNRIVDLGTEFGVSVEPSGKLDLHVFDGFVDFSASHRPPQTIEAGNSVGISPDRSVIKSTADDGLFATIDSIKQRRWEAHHRAMLKRDDLLLYYDFAETGNLTSDRETNRASNVAHGMIYGATRVAGRVRGKGGLLFEQPGDRLTFELDHSEGLSGFTIAMWLKLDRFHHRYSTLLNSNGWDLGDIHFYILGNGNLRSDVRGRRAFQSGSGTVELGSWQFVAVAWDLDSGNTRFFCNGKVYPRYRYSSGIEPGEAKPTFGNCQIGAWGDPTIHHPIRDFKGRIDEVMIFSRSLEESEIKALYDASKP